MTKISGRRIGLRLGVNDWHRKLRKWEKAWNSKLVRQKLKKDVI